MKQYLKVSFRDLRHSCGEACRICDERNCHIWISILKKQDHIKSEVAKTMKKIRKYLELDPKKDYKFKEDKKTSCLHPMNEFDEACNDPAQKKFSKWGDERPRDEFDIAMDDFKDVEPVPNKNYLKQDDLDINKIPIVPCGNKINEELDDSYKQDDTEIEKLTRFLEIKECGLEHSEIKHIDDINESLNVSIDKINELIEYTRKLKAQLDLNMMYIKDKERRNK